MAGGRTEGSSILRKVYRWKLELVGDKPDRLTLSSCSPWCKLWSIITLNIGAPAEAIRKKTLPRDSYIIYN